MKVVQILMSTYNGELFLEEQLNSIVNQDYKNIRLLIRDDGSSDRTVDILKKYSNNYDFIHYYAGNNMGVVKSFFDLMQHVDEDVEYVSFSDQDDFWLPSKISKAVDCLNRNEEKKKEPLLYCCETTIVNEKLIEIKNNIKKPKVRIGFGNALVENVCTGCTCVMNRKLFDVIIADLPDYTEMHDWWFYLVGTYFGQVLYDNHSYILYRQHGSNVLGSRSNYIKEFQTRCKQFKKNHGVISKQTSEFVRRFGLQKSEKGKLLFLVVNYKRSMKARLRICFGSEIYRQRAIDDIIFKVLFFLGLR